MATLYERSTDWCFKSVLNDTAGVLVPVISAVGDLTALFQLNEAGCLIWRLLEAPRSAEELLRGIFEEYDSPDAETARRDLECYLREMARIGAIVPVGNG